MKRLLAWVEAIGNRLPHPFWIFWWLILFVAIASALLEPIGARSLLNHESLTWFVLNMVTNFSQFAPLGVVLVMLMGVAIAESSGLLTMMMRAVALSVPRSLIVPALLMVSASSTVGSDAGVVVMPPLAAAIFKNLGRNPIVGLLVGYVGATCGYTANLLPTGTDVIAMTLTNEVTGSNPEIGVFANYYFKLGSVVMIAVLGTIITARFVEPRFERVEPQAIAPLTREERRGLLHALIGIAAMIALWLVTMWGEPKALRGAGMVPILFSLFVVGGVLYGRAVGTVKNAADVLRFMTEGMKRVGPYIVLVFAIAQFISIFQLAQLDRVAAREGAELLRAIGFDAMPVLFFAVFITVVSLINMFIGSASAKWAIFAPVFVPMLMALGYHPAFAQMLYRVGDAVTDPITPLSPFFPLLIGWIGELDQSKAKVGTVLSYLLPYVVVFWPGWILMAIVWYLIGLPVGPDSPILLAR